jgi:hypothetical protein
MTPTYAVALAAVLAAAPALAQDPAATQKAKDDAARAFQELPPAPGEAGLEAPPLPVGDAFGQSRPSGRDAAEDLLVPLPLGCPEGMVPILEDGQAVLGPDGKPACRMKRPFIKGELTNLGATKLKVKDSRFGIRLGYARLDGSSYLSTTPELDLAFGKFSFGLGAPLHIRLYANGLVDGGGFHLRPNDYNSSSSYAQVIRFITYGNKEDNLYFNISQLFAASIGHGAIVRRYSGNVDQNITRVGAQLDAYGRYGGFEAFIGDIVAPTHFMSGLAFIKPLGFLSGPLLSTLGQTSLGFSAAADLHAPFALTRQTQTTVAPYPKVGDDAEPEVAVERSAEILGLDLETKILKTENSDLKPFIDYSRMLDIQDDQGRPLAGGGGLTLGILGRFNAGEVKPHAFRAILEGRYYDGNYQPGYFDTFYEVQKYQFITGRASTAYEPKLATILSPYRQSQKRGGLYAEFGYQYNQGLALMISYEDSIMLSGGCTTAAGVDCLSARYNSDIGKRNFTFHIEYPAYSWLQFFGSFYRRSFGGDPSPIDWSHPLGDNTLIYSAVRLHILPVLFLNFRYYRSWQADPVLGEMKNVTGLEADLEIGYEFDRSRR